MKADKSDCLIDITVDAYIPETTSGTRPAASRRTSASRPSRTATTPSDVLDELIDRYGDVPASVTGLVDISLIRVQAARLGVYEISQSRDALLLYSDRLDMALRKPLLQSMGRRLLVNGSGKLLSVGAGAAGGKAAGVLRMALEKNGRGRVLQKTAAPGYNEVYDFRLGRERC